MKEFISFGEILLRLSASSGERLSQATSCDVYYGGSEANIACALAQWGITAEHVGVLPDNEIGKAALQSIQRFGVQTHHINLQPGRMGIYFLEQGNSIRSPHVLYDRFHSAFSELNPEDFNWKEILSGAKWFHWSGITPAISQQAADACLKALQTANELDIPVSADINYRRVLWQYGKKPVDIMPKLIAKSKVIIGSPHDFENCTGISFPPNAEFDESCNLLKSHFPNVELAVQTQRVEHDATHQELSGLLWRDHQVHQSKTYKLHSFLDRIGSGDAFAAGLIYKLLQKKSFAETIEFATAAAALKHTIKGDVLLATENEINTISQSSTHGKLLR